MMTITVHANTERALLDASTLTLTLSVLLASQLTARYFLVQLFTFSDHLRSEPASVLSLKGGVLFALSRVLWDEYIVVRLD